MISTYKFRLYPTRAQAKLMDETLETCRRLYNSLLAQRIENGTRFYELSKKLVELKRENKYLKAVHSQVLQDVNLRLDKAYQAFFSGLSKYPRFRRKGKYNSFAYPQHIIGFNLLGNFLKLGKIGKVRIRLHRAIIGTIKRAAIIKDIDQWFVALSVEVEQITKGKKSETSVGVDVGIANIIALSNGEIIPNPKFLSHSGENIKYLQRELSRKKKGSKNRKKAKRALAKSWRKVRRQRDDFSHKLSFKLAKENDTIVFEDLKIQNMVKNHNLASAIMDSTWGKLRQLTAYKAERRGGRVILVNSSGTSQKCSGCGEVVPKSLSERVHRCLRCGLTLDRDINAARNILKGGLEQSHAETEPLLVRRISKFQSRKREANEFIRG
ncbi:MAG: RNA-guided endonuclease InsQ/TnpB family protein [Nitrososphaerales archaeon]